MGIGGGESFSASAALTIVSIIGGIFLLVLPTLIKWLEKKNTLSEKNISNLQNVMVLFPPLTFFLAMILQIYEHLMLNFRYEHVSIYLNDSSSILSRVFATFIGPSGKIELLILVYATCVSFLIYNKPGYLFSKFPSLQVSQKFNPRFIQLNGFFWFLILAGLLPSTSFAKNNVENVGIGLSDSQIYSSFMEGVFGIIILGICLSLTVFSISTHTFSKQHKKSHHHLFVLIPLFLLVLAFTNISVLFTGLEWYLSGNFQLFSLELEQAVIDPYFGSRLAVFVSIFSVAVFLPMVQHWDKNVNLTKFEGGNRWLALGLCYLHGVFVIILGTFFVLKNTDSIDSTQGSLWLALKAAAPIIFFGLIGSLLPVIGFDEDVRPELWGWRMGLTSGLLVNSLWNPFVVIAIPSVILAILCTFFVPLFVETNNRLSMKYKVMFAAITLLLTVYALLQTSIVNIAVSMLVVLSFSFISALTFELANNYKLSNNNDYVTEQE